jgi:hypothetical protein
MYLEVLVIIRISSNGPISVEQGRRKHLLAIIAYILFIMPSQWCLSSVNLENEGTNLDKGYQGR